MRAQQDKLAARFPGIGIFGEPTAGAVDGADLVVLAVKPQQMREAAAQALAPHIDGIPVVMTIAAGHPHCATSRAGSAVTRASCARCPTRRRWSAPGISGAFAPPTVDAAGRELAGRVLGRGRAR